MGVSKKRRVVWSELIIDACEILPEQRAASEAAFERSVHRVECCNFVRSRSYGVIFLVIQLLERKQSIKFVFLNWPADFGAGVPASAPRGTTPPVPVRFAVGVVA